MELNKCRIWLAVILVTAGHEMASAQEEKDFINGLIEKADMYYQQRPQERLFLHTDRSVYFSGDDILVNAYITRKSTLKFSDRSQEVRIILEDETGTEIISTTFPNEGGITGGKFELPGSLPQGIYHLTGYTLLQDNILSTVPFSMHIFLVHPDQGFIMEYAFDQEIYRKGETFKLELRAFEFDENPVKNLKIEHSVTGVDKTPVRGSGKTTRYGLYTISGKITENATDPVVIEINAEKRRQSQTIRIAVPLMESIGRMQFFTDNGGVMPGKPSSIACRAYNSDGIPIYFEGAVFHENREISKVIYAGDGYGYFEVNPAAGETYVFRSGNDQYNSFELPEIPEKGIAINIAGMAGDKLQVKTSYRGGKFRDTLPVIVSIFRNGLLLWSGTGTLGQTRDLLLPVKGIPAGLIKIVLFSKNGELLKERLIYMENDPFPEISVSLDRSEYRKRQKVRAELKIFPPDMVAPRDVYLSASVVPADLRMGKEILLDDFMLIEANLKPDCREIILESRENQDREKLLNTLLPGFEWNGYSWDMILDTAGQFGQTGRFAAGGPFEEHVEGEQAITGHYPELIKAEKLMDFSIGIEDQRFPSKNEELYKKQLESGASLLEVIRSIKPYQLKGNKIVFPGSDNSQSLNQGALIVINNQMMGEDISVLRSISPKEVESIIVATRPSDIQRYTGLNTVGVIDIKMKGFGLESRLAKEDRRDELIIDSEGVYLQGFPDYSRESDINSVNRDFRSVLYWDPDVRLDQGLSSILEFYSSDKTGRYLITVQGFVGSYPVAVEKEFTVK